MVFLLYSFVMAIESFVAKKHWLSFTWNSLINSSHGNIKNKITININVKFGVNFSLDAILLIYINKISSPPISIKNIIIAIQDESIDFDMKIVDTVVWINNKTPLTIGVFTLLITVEIHIIILNKAILMSTSSLKKTLVLGINNAENFLLCWSFKGNP